MRLVNLFLLLSVLLAALFGSSAAAQTNAGRPPFRYGIIVSNAVHFPQAAGLGFGWVKIYVSWKSIESSKGNFGNYPDYAIQQAHMNNLQVVASIFDIPDYESGNPPPSSMPNDFGDFMYQLASHFQGQIAAYEIWNEPNVDSTWGWGNPDASILTAMIKAAYPKVKQADPGALVVSGGLSNTLDGNGSSAISDLTYLQQMVQDGIVGNVDAIGIHPYPGPCDPAATSCAASGGVMFRRAEQEHDTLVQAGAGNVPLWITEAGYFSTPSDLGSEFSACNGSGSGISGFANWELDPNTKANDLVAAFQYAYNNWPWLGAFILMNLDMTTDTFRATCDPVRFWAILDQNGNPTPAYNALQSMVKYTPQVSVNAPTSSSAKGTMTIAGTVSDPTASGSPQIDAAVVSVDGPYGSGSELGMVSFSGAGFTATFDATRLTAFQNHVVYIYLHTPTGGWAISTVGFVAQPMINATPSNLFFWVDPSQRTPQSVTITLGRNDSNSGSYGWSATESSNAAWLTIQENHNNPMSVNVTMNPGSLAPGTYSAMITLNPGSDDATYFQNWPFTIPVTVIVGTRHQVEIPFIEDGGGPPL
jgi:hypothetical protein